MKRYSFTRESRDGRVHFALLPLAWMADEVYERPESEVDRLERERGTRFHEAMMGELARIGTEVDVLGEQLGLLNGTLTDGVKTI